MRAKRAKQYKKLMNQFSQTFGFREPYQVLGSLAHFPFKKDPKTDPGSSGCRYCQGVLPDKNGSSWSAGKDTTRDNQAEYVTSG